MRQLGEYLQKERESRGITLQDISLETKIRLEYLEAIEKGEFNKLPGEFYTRTYLRAYAKTISLSETVVLEKYTAIVSETEALGEKEVLPVAKKWDGTLQKTVITIGEALSIKRFHIIITVALVVLIAFLAICFIWRANVKDQDISVKDPDGQIVNETEVENSELEELVSPKESSDNIEPLEEISTEEDIPKDYLLTLKSHGECWYEIEEVGQLLKSGILKYNEEISVKSQGLLQIKLGRPFAVSLFFNAEKINLGDDVRELSIDSSGEITILKRW